MQEGDAGTAPGLQRHHCIYAELHQEKRVSSSFKEAWSQQGKNMTVFFMDSCQCVCRVLTHIETLLTSISISTGIFASLHCKC